MQTRRSVASLAALARCIRHFKAENNSKSGEFLLERTARSAAVRDATQGARSRRLLSKARPCRPFPSRHSPFGRERVADARTRLHDNEVEEPGLRARVRRNGLL